MKIPVHKKFSILIFIFLIVIFPFCGNYVFGIQTEMQQGLDPGEVCVIEINIVWGQSLPF